MGILIAAIVMAWRGWLQTMDYSANDEKVGLFTVIAMHIQLLTGMILFFLSPFVQFGDMKNTMGDSQLRFWTVEHTLLMLAAVVLVTLGRAGAKKVEEATAKHKKIAIFFIIALILILVSIPWPFTQISRTLFR